MLRILVPLDGSALGERALAYAAALKPERLDLLQVFEPSVSELSPSPRYLEEVASPLRDQGLAVRCHAVAGLPRREIVAATHSTGANLLVLASLGRTGPQRWLRGSVAESVTRRAPCPTLVVRPTHTPRPGYRLLLVPLDTTPAGEEALHYVRSRFAPEAVRLVLVSATSLAANRYYVPDAGDARQGMVTSLARYLEGHAENLRNLGWTVETRAIDDSAGPAIVGTASDLQADLVVMASHGRTGLARWVMGSVTEHVLRHGPCPTLVVRAETAARAAAV